ncbi:MAG: threonine ammonia-lyase [Oscillospiraceae bacterium]|nr:threonine ammonia-lyase [Oscillospiraceae bacterium]
MEVADLTLEKIYQAAHVLKPVARKTSVIRAVNIAPRCELYLKAENLQVTGAFKVRGAYFKMSMLTDEEKVRGVVACSAGNHAQGVALAAKENGIKSTIFVPSAAPISKIEAARSYGSEIRLVNGVYDDAYNAALEYLEESNAVFVHPFEDVDVIAGQGTIGLEVLEQLPEVEAIIVPVGGGGLISGVAYAAKKLKPSCKIYGVQAAGAGSMSKSLDENKLSALNRVSTFADGIAVKSPGKMTFALCSEYVDEIVTVTDDEIATAILTLMEKQKLVTEGAGAVSVAAVMFGKLPIDGKKCISIVSGGNIDVNILSRVINRGLTTTGRLTELTIEMLDMPGQLSAVSGIVSDLGANVVKVRHDPAGENSDINSCVLHLSMETKNLDHLQDIKKAMANAGYKILKD